MTFDKNKYPENCPRASYWTSYTHLLVHIALMILPRSGGLVDFSLAVDAVVHEDVTPKKDAKTPPAVFYFSDAEKCKWEGKFDCLLVGNFHRVQVSDCICIICQHFLWTVVRPKLIFWFLWVVVTLGDDTRTDSWLIICLKVNIIYLTFKLHRQRPGRSSVDEAWAITYYKEKRMLCISFYSHFHLISTSQWSKSQHPNTPTDFW